MMVEVQCSSCHTRYRVDEEVLPEGTPTFKCSRCGHVFSVEPRRTTTPGADPATAPPETQSRPASDAATVRSSLGEAGDRVPKPEAAEPPADDSPRGTRPDASSTTPDLANREHPLEAEPIAQPSNPEPSTEELLARPFKDRQTHPESGENLAFDFDEDSTDPGSENESGLADRADIDPPRGARRDVESTRQPPPRWQVGDEPGLGMPSQPEHFVFETSLPPRRGRGAAAAHGRGPELFDEDEAPVYNHGVTRSARFFLALILLVACGFLATTVAIHAAPAVALDLLNRLPVIGGGFVSPVVPAQRVALRDVRADYRRGRDGRLTLVVAGQAENVSAGALRTIRIKSRIWSSTGGAVAAREVYCGNSLTTRTVAQMTSHEIEFFEGLPPPKSFTLDSSSSCPFVIVFVDPPAQLSHFDVAVTEADPVGPDQAAPSTS